MARFVLFAILPAAVAVLSASVHKPSCETKAVAIESGNQTRRWFTGCIFSRLLASRMFRCGSCVVDDRRDGREFGGPMCAHCVGEARIWQHQAL